MGLRQSGRTIAVVVLASAASALVAYHYGTRRHSNRANLQGRETSVPANSTCVPFAEASSHVGEASCISGRILKVFTSKAGNTYLDFCEDYRSCPFSSVIFSEDRGKFGDLSFLQGQVVEIRGLVSYYKERPQIIVREPEQLKLRE